MRSSSTQTALVAGALLAGLLASTAARRPASAQGGDASLPEASAPDAAAVGCSGDLAPVDTSGHCCWPGQRWSAGRCEGEASACPPGFRRAAGQDGGACALAPCAEGWERTADALHCCWPGQRWDARERSCVGEVRGCPEGAAMVDGVCLPRASVAASDGGVVPRGMLRVPGATLQLGPRDGSRGRWVTVGAFALDRTEVTIEQYERCARAGRCAPRVASSAGAASLPATGVTWGMAVAYCAFVGARLPSEAEWELAARGVEGRTYPWGERAPDCALARMQGCGAGPVAVGTHGEGASPFGVLDLAGNVAEWTLDRSGALPRGMRWEPRGPEEGERRVVRGGSFESGALALRGFAREERHHEEARHDLGFRCARPL